MDVTTLAIIALGAAVLVLAAVALWQRIALRRTRAALEEALEEVETMRRHDAQMHEAFEIYRERHKHLIDRVRPRRITDEQRRGLRLHLRELPDLRVRIRVAADTEPAVAAAELSSALIAAGAKVQIEETEERLGDSELGGLLEVPDAQRSRLLRAALRAYAFPLTDAALAIVRVRRKNVEDDSPEAIITIGSRRIPPELTDLPPPPQPPPAKKPSVIVPVGMKMGGGTPGLE